MKSIFKIQYEAKAQSSKSVEGNWLAEERNVLSDGDAQDAVNKARVAALKEKWDVTDDDGKKTGVCRITDFRLLSVEQIAVVDL